MADQLRRSDRSDSNRYNNLDKAAEKPPANENQKQQQPVRSPGWTQYGDMASQQMSALRYDKAAQAHAQQRPVANSNGNEQGTRKEARLDELVQKYASEQKPSAQEQVRQRERKGPQLEL